MATTVADVHFGGRAICCGNTTGHFGGLKLGIQLRCGCGAA